eukprot:scaffold7202_cov403-Prasinococcus_capsulatus_cf.AAC.6
MRQYVVWIDTNIAAVAVHLPYFVVIGVLGLVGIMAADALAVCILVAVGSVAAGFTPDTSATWGTGRCSDEPEVAVSTTVSPEAAIHLQDRTTAVEASNVIRMPALEGAIQGATTLGPLVSRRSLQRRSRWRPSQRKCARLHHRLCQGPSHMLRRRSTPRQQNQCSVSTGWRCEYKDRKAQSGVLG